ncbi:MAG: DNA-binding protein [Anaerocolumna sp.]|jgi:hypothetical protein|nr:DNA-binding protein [Anaerocolumna sp.]
MNRKRLLLFHEKNKIYMVLAVLYQWRNKMEYLTTAEVAEKWGITRRRVTVLCDEGRIIGAVQKGNIWLIPLNAEKPIDGRRVRYFGHKE